MNALKYNVNHVRNTRVRIVDTVAPSSPTSQIHLTRISGGNKQKRGRKIGKKIYGRVCYAGKFKTLKSHLLEVSLLKRINTVSALAASSRALGEGNDQQQANSFCQSLHHFLFCPFTTQDVITRDWYAKACGECVYVCISMTHARIYIYFP